MSECRNTTTTADHVPCVLPDGHRTGSNPTACRSQTQYVATINIPGYLPQDDEPPTFDTAREAWQYLKDERMRVEDDYPEGEPLGEYSDTYQTLDYIASREHQHGNPHEDHPTNKDGTGTVYGATPGSDSPHDLGLAYCVTLAE